MARTPRTSGGRGHAFGPFLSYLLEQKGMDKEQLAAATELGYGTIRNIVGGYTDSDPSFGTLLSISNALGVDFGNLVSVIAELPRTSAPKAKRVSAIVKYLNTHVLSEVQTARVNQAIGALEALVNSADTVPLETIHREIALKYNMIPA